MPVFHVMIVREVVESATLSVIADTADQAVQNVSELMNDDTLPEDHSIVKNIEGKKKVELTSEWKFERVSE